jgi:methylmalonyl-CoA/ethylmalonyl-CoA epimerase
MIDSWPQRYVLHTFGDMKRLEHLGIAVKDLAAAEKIFTDVLGEGPFKREEVLDEGVITSFFKTGESKLELLQSTTPDGPIARHIEKRGEGLHHVAFHVDDLEHEIKSLEAKGYRCISGPKPGADGKQIAFLHPSDTAKVLVELCAD